MARLTPIGANKVAAAVAGGPELEITKFVFANIPGLSHTDPEPAEEPLPAPAHIVFEREPTAAGLIDENRVTYSQMLTTDIGDFSFNWIGLVYTDPEDGDQLIAFAYVPLTQKIRTSGAVAGNVITRNMVIEHLGIVNGVPVEVSAESWMFDFSGDYAYATKDEAEAGELSTRVMSPLRVRQAFDKFLVDNTGENEGTVAAGDDSRIVGALQKSANLEDLDSVESARDNLELGNAATKNVSDIADKDYRLILDSSGQLSKNQKYHIVSNGVFTLPEVELLEVGDTVVCSKSIYNSPIIQAFGIGINIKVGKQNGDIEIDSSIIFDINSEIIFVWNGLAWEL